MPLPEKQPNENKDDFISRCMSDNVMTKEFPDTDQRLAVCNSQWESNTKSDK